MLKHGLKVSPESVSKDYKSNRQIRIASAKKRRETHPEPRTSELLPLRPKSCRPTLKTQQASIQQKYTGPSPKVSQKHADFISL